MTTQRKKLRYLLSVYFFASLSIEHFRDRLKLSTIIQRTNWQTLFFKIWADNGLGV